MVFPTTSLGRLTDRGSAAAAAVVGGLRELLSRDRVERVVALAIEELRRDEGRDLAGPLRRCSATCRRSSRRRAQPARPALREYLGGERLAVFPDAERGYRVEGELVLPWAWARTERAARNPEGPRAAHPVVAGARFVPQPALWLPVAWRLEAA